MITGTVLVLNEVGVNVALLMGGAAVFGLAVAFGAQNLIRDYFYGFVILLENQYKLNDVVRIGTIAGQVERITLRMTVLRDLEGNVHFLPNGQISSVCNKTHGWSRALFDIPVAYKEDVDRVMLLLLEVCKQVQMDPQFGPLILEDATMLGVDNLGDSAVNIKFYIKTKPLQQWAIKREILRRVKKQFDESQIEIPFPHRMVYYKNLSEEPADDAVTPPTRSAAKTRTTGLGGDMTCPRLEMLFPSRSTLNWRLTRCVAAATITGQLGRLCLEVPEVVPIGPAALLTAPLPAPSFTRGKGWPKAG
jgi:small-conductance mechanosensitive channel